MGLSGCPESPTSALVTLQGVDAVQSLTLTVSLPSGSVQRSFGVLGLPQTVLLQLPDQAVNVSVTANAIASDGRPVNASDSVASAPHKQVTLTLVLGAAADAGTDGPLDAATPVIAWRSVSASTAGLGARHSGHAAYDSLHQQLVMFGGVDNTFSTVGGTFTWDGTQWTKRMISGPGPRRGYGLAYDSARHVTVLFGGGATTDNNDIWEWDGAAGSWTNKTPLLPLGPVAVLGAGIAYHAARQRTVVFGGYSSTNKLSPPDTWEWDGTSWSLQSPMMHPIPDNGHAMVYDSARQVVVYFGARSGSTPGVDVWEYDASGAWAPKTAPNGPLRRRSIAAAYDSVRQVTVVFGGLEGGTDVDDTWEWNGTAWTQRMIAGPAARRSAAAAFDEARGQLVLFGGASGHRNGANDSGPATYFGDTWLLY